MNVFFKSISYLSESCYICVAFGQRDVNRDILKAKNADSVHPVNELGKPFKCKFCIKDSHLNWPVRLTVRTPGFHPGNRGSIPLRAAKSGSLVVRFFYIKNKTNDLRICLEKRKIRKVLCWNDKGGEEEIEGT